jgi:hypothetical protein
VRLWVESCYHQVSDQFGLVKVLDFVGIRPLVGLGMVVLVGSIGLGKDLADNMLDIVENIGLGFGLWNSNT